MSYTKPDGQPQGVAVYFTNKIREALIAEVVAINQYEEHIANSDMTEVNEVWNHIIQDEKDHYGMFLTLLRKYDPTQYQKYLFHKDDTFQPSPMQSYQPDYSKNLILGNIRSDIKGEFEAVVLYEQLILEMPFQDMKDTFHNVVTAEKEHAEHLTKLLLSLDKQKYNELT